MRRSIVILCLLFSLLGCTETGSNQVDKYPIIEKVGNETVPKKENIKIPEASGILVVKDDIVELDYSNNSKGYVMVKTLTTVHKRLKIQVKKENETYNYDVSIEGEFLSYPLNMGDGVYTIQVRENVEGNTYALLFSQDIHVQLNDENDPYLYPSYIVNYDVDSLIVDKSFEICEGAQTQIERVYRTYNWVVKNIEYDWKKVEEVQGKFVLPILDETLLNKTGICFDYAALMTSMLRVQQIPIKLTTGFVEEGYHAWVEIYVQDVGWINPEIYFESDEWKLLDPTFASTNENYKGTYENKYSY